VTTAGTVAIAASSDVLDIKSAPVFVKATDTSITLQWEKVAAADKYIVKYSSGVSVMESLDPNAQYQEETDPVSQTGTTITGLAPNTKYYFALIALDKQGNESNVYSDELSVSTKAPFAIESVNVTTSDTMSVKFTHSLGTDPITLKVTKTANNANLTIVSVSKNATDPTLADVVFGAPLTPATAYSLTIVSAKDVDGNAIVTGVSALKEFTSPQTFTTSPIVLAATGSQSTRSGATLAATGAVAPATKDLTKAQTGAREDFILFAAVLLSLGFAVVYSKRKRA
jgi:hypothetical protein